jgi:TRAP-type C4-dicarboxylate transport system permease large subunit
MSEDERLSELLRQDAPPARDPMFRLKVLERRETARFRRHSLLLAAIALVLTVVAWIGIAIGGETAETIIALVFIAALAVGYVLYRPAVTRLLQRFRF